MHVSWQLVCLFIVNALHIVYTPYTKVEESFNIQAIHDLIYHQAKLKEYDHHEFPGVVPRTFIGPILVSLLSSPFAAILKLMNYNKDLTQLLVRFILGCLTSISFFSYKRAVAKTLSPTIANLLTVFTLSQFHFIFYSSRTLPNTFALILVLPALGFWLERKIEKFIWLSAFSAVIFRAELCLLVGPLLLISLVQSKISIWHAVKHSLSAGLLAIGLTTLVDSIFWGKLLWPEGAVLYYNTILNKSSNWGTSPFLWYFYSAIPRCLLLTIIFVPFGFLSGNKSFLGLLFSSVLFVFLYSFLPHKELRFIIYTIPVMNTAAAAGISNILHWLRRNKLLSKMVISGTAMTVLFNVAATLLLSSISHHNYPGGVAFSKLHQKVGTTEKNISIHIGNYAAQTGVTRFGEINSHWKYSKDESIKPGTDNLLAYTHALHEAPCSSFDATHDTLATIAGFSKIELNPKLVFSPIKIRLTDKLCVLQRRNSKLVLPRINIMQEFNE